MASQDLPENPLDSKQTLEFIRSALHPDERQFFKQYLGQESPDIMDYLLPQGRFAKARDIRESIVKGVLSNLIPSTTNPQATLGEARSINPDFPAPPNAITQGYGPAEGPGAPVPRYSQQEMSQYNMPPDWAGHLQEGPRPTTPVPGPQENLNALLPRSHQNALQADIHKLGLRGFSPNSTVKADALEKVRSISMGLDQEEYPGQLKDLKVVAGMQPKLPGQDTAQGRKAESDAQLAEQKNQRYVGLTDQQIATMKARESSDNAKAHDLWQGFETRMNELNSRITKNTAQGKAAGDLMGVNQEKQQVQQARLLLAVEKSRNARQNLDPAEQDLWDNRILDMLHSGLTLTRDEPSFLQGLFGGSGESHLVPQSNLPVPQGQPPSGNPMQFKPGDITSPEQGGIVNPETITNIQPVPPQSDPEARKTYMRTMYNIMKDNEVKVLDGKKFQRKGSQLIEVK